MRAIVCTKYGAPDVLELKELAAPVPKENEVLVKVYATTVTSGDCRVRGFKSPILYYIPMRLFLGLRKPRNPVLGVEFSGVVEAVGSSVTRFGKGDAVFVFTGMKFGANAEYAVIPETGLLAAKPDHVSFAEAAAVGFGGTTALHFFRKAGLRSGQKVFVYGASGAVGTAAVQLAKHFGAEVTAACSAANLDLVRSLGADYAVDYAKEQFSGATKRYDLVFDAVGKCPKAVYNKLLSPQGRFLSVEGSGVAKVLREDMQLLGALMREGKMRPVIDREYRPEQCREAHSYVETGRKKGNVVIIMNEP